MSAIALKRWFEVADDQLVGCRQNSATGNAHALLGREEACLFRLLDPGSRVQLFLRSIVTCALLAPSHPALAESGLASPFGGLAHSVQPSAESLQKLAIRLIAREEAARAGVPYDLVDAVIKIESDYRPGRVGDVGEIGLMQVRPGTAAMMGFQGATADLSLPAINIHYGATYLGEAWRLAKGDVCRALMKYRAGHAEEAMSPLSVTYCTRARAHLAEMRSPLAASIKDADLQAAKIAPSGTSPAGRARNGPVFWAKFEARIKRINAATEAKWKRMAQR